jgi:hypothetical protein
VAALVQAGVLETHDEPEGPRNVAGAVRRRYRLVASIATGTAMDRLRARVLDVLTEPRTMRDIRTLTGVRLSQAEHLVRTLWEEGRLERQRQPGARTYRYWSV